MIRTSKFRARELRKNLTEAEKRMWYFLRKKRFLDLRFSRQVVLDDYIVDFLCKELKLIIELDGEQHNEKNALKYDQNRTAYLEQKGYTILRYWNHDVFKNVYMILDDIFNHVEEIKCCQKKRSEVNIERDIKKRE